MSDQLWDKSPFYSVSGSLVDSKTETELPYNIGSISRQGGEHQRNGINNQDAVNIIIEDDIIIGVLCDGCTNNHANLINQYSHNGVGAVLLSHLISNLCLKKTLNRKKRLDSKYFLKYLHLGISKALLRLQSNLKTPIQNSIEVKHNLFLSTVIGFVIRKNDYLVFSYGDGLVEVNNQTFNLSQDSGKYISNVPKNINKSDESFRLIAYGESSSLNKIFIASDGFNVPDILNNKSFQNFLNSKENNATGLIDLLPEFHLDVLNNIYKNPKNKNWPHDDATAILIRRT